MSSVIILLILVIAVALIFEYINGFHDAANAIATVVSTKVLTPRKAILYAAVLNVFGAFFGTHVAKTIGSGIVDKMAVSQEVIICALLGAIIWNLITWLFGIPSSSSHALIGGLLGAAVVHNGLGVVHVNGLISKVIIPFGTLISATSPTFFPNRPFPIGVFTAILLSFKLASLSDTKV